MTNKPDFEKFQQSSSITLTLTLTLTLTSPVQYDATFVPVLISTNETLADNLGTVHNHAGFLPTNIDALNQPIIEFGLSSCDHGHE